MSIFPNYDAANSLHRDQQLLGTMLSSPTEAFVASREAQNPPKEKLAIENALDTLVDQPWKSQQISPESPASAAAVSEPLQEQDGNYDDQYYENIDLAERAAEIQDNYQTAADQAAMSFSERMMQKQMDFEREMANSSYQRAVEDLRKAGLNPILAYSQGGAAVPSVSAASGVSGSRVAPNYRDTGYTKYQLDYAYIKMAVQAATDIIGDVFRLIPKL